MLLHLMQLDGAALGGVDDAKIDTESICRVDPYPSQVDLVRSGRRL